jgi:hypothetical protein
MGIKLGLDDVQWRYVLQHERDTIIEEEHASLTRGYFHADTIARKILQDRLWWCNCIGIVEKR